MAFSGATGAVLQNFEALSNPAFTGGARVGVVNVNGQADIVVSAGPGSSPQVDVYDGRNLGIIDNLFAYAQAFAGGVYVGGG
jgi:hypothetical protein